LRVSDTTRENKTKRKTIENLLKDNEQRT
jgi:hypothetical protein